MRIVKFIDFLIQLNIIFFVNNFISFYSESIQIRKSCCCTLSMQFCQHVCNALDAASSLCQIIIIFSLEKTQFMRISWAVTCQNTKIIGIRFIWNIPDYILFLLLNKFLHFCFMQVEFFFEVISTHAIWKWIGINCQISNYLVSLVCTSGHFSGFCTFHPCLAAQMTYLVLHKKISPA